MKRIFGKNHEHSDRIVVLDTETFKNAVLNKPVQLADVRTRMEYNSGHIPNAVLIDFFNNSQFAKKFASFDKEKPVYLYCRSGNRSQRAAKKLVRMGFEKIYDLKGGYKAWK